MSDPYDPPDDAPTNGRMVRALQNAPRKPPTLGVKPGFLWTRVKWSGPRAKLDERCSYCGEPIPDEGECIPLVMWRDDGSAAQFCEKCMAEWFGLEGYPAEGLNS